jgi:vancomycin resistance protein YoaR
VGRSILRFKNKKAGRLLCICFLIVAVIFCVFAGYFLYYTGKIYPNIKVAGIDIGGYTVQGAASLLSSNITIPQNIQLTGAGQNFSIDTNDFDFSYDYTASAQRAFNLVRTGNFFYDLSGRVNLLFQPKNTGLAVNLNEDKLDKIISVLSGQVSQEPVEPSITLVNGNITIYKGAAGTIMDSKALRIAIGENLSLLKTGSIEIPISAVDNSLNQDQADELKLRAEKYLGKSLQLKFEYNTYTLSGQDLIKLLDTGTGFNNQAIDATISEISGKVNRDPQNPKFNFENGRVTEFQPALDGIQVDTENFKNQIILTLTQIESGSDKVTTLDIPVIRTPPEVSTESVNNLGINELIGRGTSTYFHSIPGRVHNVVLAASRINGTLVKPGDTFSFNDTLGDVSAFTGYQQAYIISGGKTILGDGGGVCQVSTTLFRAILNAGLPVVERAAHAYRVGYYEQDSPPGFDATVYGPSPDLKFTNNTSGYILIEATANPKNYSLVFELYGTGDGRVVTLSKPVISNITPALPTVYQDDPTLPAGTLKQTDFSASGATVKFNYTVTRAGQTIFQKTFVSNYQPWAAVYLRGTGPAI